MAGLIGLLLVAAGFFGLWGWPAALISSGFLLLVLYLHVETLSWMGLNKKIYLYVEMRNNKIG